MRTRVKVCCIQSLGEARADQLDAPGFEGLQGPVAAADVVEAAHPPSPRGLGAGPEDGYARP